MTSEEFALHYHELKLDVELFRRVGKSFQDFFEAIMEKSDPSFMMVKPMGKEGDWKSDGYSTASATVYQCYAPEDMTGTQSAKKINEDFEGAKCQWKEKMQRWVFVWSSESALPPQAVSAIAELKAANSHLSIDHMGRAGLWGVVKKLTRADRESLLGVVPDPNAASLTTAAEIQVLMKHLGTHSSGMTNIASFDLTAIIEKLQRNGLSAAVEATITPALPVAKLVREFVTSMPDPEFSNAIAADLAKQYVELAESADHPDIIFGGLIEYVRGQSRPDPKFFWAAAGIVTHYFELCDIFQL